MFLKRTEKRVGHSFVSLKSDHGKEFENSNFIDYGNEQVSIIIFLPQEHPVEQGRRA